MIHSLRCSHCSSFRSSLNSSPRFSLHFILPAGFHSNRRFSWLLTQTCCTLGILLLGLARTASCRFGWIGGLKKFSDYFDLLCFKHKLELIAVLSWSRLFIDESGRESEIWLKNFRIFKLFRTTSANNRETVGVTVGRLLGENAVDNTENALENTKENTNTEENLRELRVISARVRQ